MPRKKQASFEENLQELENIVVRLEKGQSPLADIVADYTKGMELSAKCMDALKQEKRKWILCCRNPLRERLWKSS